MRVGYDAVPIGERRYQGVKMTMRTDFCPNCEPTTAGHAPGCPLVESAEIWIEETPLEYPVLVTNCPRLASPDYQWDESIKWTWRPK